MISYIWNHNTGGRQTVAGQEFKHLLSSQCKDLQPMMHTHALMAGWLLLPADYTCIQGCFQCQQQQQQQQQ